MAPRRVVMLAMPCAEVVEIGDVLAIFYVVNERLAQAGISDEGYAVEVVSPVPTVCAWPGLRLVADRSYRPVRGPIDTLIVIGVDRPDNARRDLDLIRWLTRTAPAVRTSARGGLVNSDIGAYSRPVSSRTRR
jgi:transcriptional regulator GlxA family with amidase domain